MEPRRRRFGCRSSIPMENIQPTAWRTSNAGIAVPSSLSRQLRNDLKHRAAAEILDFTRRHSAKLGSAIQPSTLAECRLPPRHVSISSSTKRVQDGFPSKHHPGYAVGATGTQPRSPAHYIRDQYPPLEVVPYSSPAAPGASKLA